MQRRYVKSRKTRGLSRDQVIGGMDRKLAGGEGAFGVRQLRQRAYSHTTYAVVLACGVMGLGSIALVALQLAPHRIPEMRDDIRYQSPVALLAAAAREGQLTPDEHAGNLRDLLLNYSRVPEPFRPPYPRFTMQETLEALTTVWPELTDETRKRLGSDLPALARRRPRL
jgi:hypothetical protein